MKLPHSTLKCYHKNIIRINVVIGIVKNIVLQCSFGNKFSVNDTIGGVFLIHTINLKIMSNLLCPSGLIFLWRLL